eukprot:scaffold5207_cov96-Skeletonema_dohrnii-CCMP3373.AAC.2
MEYQISDAQRIRQVMPEKKLNLSGIHSGVAFIPAGHVVDQTCHMPSLISTQPLIVSPLQYIVPVSPSIREAAHDENLAVGFIVRDALKLMLKL